MLEEEDEDEEEFAPPGSSAAAVLFGGGMPPLWLVEGAVSAISTFRARSEVTSFTEATSPHPPQSLPRRPRRLSVCG